MHGYESSKAQNMLHSCGSYEKAKNFHRNGVYVNLGLELRDATLEAGRPNLYG